MFSQRSFLAFASLSFYALPRRTQSVEGAFDAQIESVFVRLLAFAVKEGLCFGNVAFAEVANGQILFVELVVVDQQQPRAALAAIFRCDRASSLLLCKHHTLHCCHLSAKIGEDYARNSQICRAEMAISEFNSRF